MENKDISRKINLLQNQIKYLKNKRTKKCKMCGKDFAPNNMKEIYCSDDCRQKAIKETKRRNYLRYRQKPEFVEKNKQYLKEWRIKTGRVIPKPETVSLDEYNKLKAVCDVKEQAYNDLCKRCDEILKDYQRLILENHQLRGKTFIQKLKDLF